MNDGNYHPKLTCQFNGHDFMPIKAWDGDEWRPARVCKVCDWENIMRDGEWVGANLRNLRPEDLAK